MSHDLHLSPSVDRIAELIEKEDSMEAATQIKGAVMEWLLKSEPARSELKRGRSVVLQFQTADGKEPVEIPIHADDFAAYRRSKQAESKRPDLGALRRLATLLPPSERERYVTEWMDHLQCERECGGNPRQVLWSLVFHTLRLAIDIRIGRLRQLTRRLS